MYDLGMTFRFILNLNNALSFELILCFNCPTEHFHFLITGICDILLYITLGDLFNLIENMYPPIEKYV